IYPEGHQDVPEVQTASRGGDLHFARSGCAARGSLEVQRLEDARGPDFQSVPLRLAHMELALMRRMAGPFVTDQSCDEARITAHRHTILVVRRQKLRHQLLCAPRR